MASESACTREYWVSFVQISGTLVPLGRGERVNAARTLVQNEPESVDHFTISADFTGPFADAGNGRNHSLKFSLTLVPKVAGWKGLATSPRILIGRSKKKSRRLEMNALKPETLCTDRRVPYSATLV